MTEEMRTENIAVGLLTGGADRPYVFGLVNALISKGVVLDLVGSNDLDFAEFRGHPAINFLNLRGDQSSDANLSAKVARVLKYYGKLIWYAATARPKVFHILWNNKFEHFDRVILMLYYKLLGKRIAFTVHNVNAARRDRRDTRFNRLTLRIQYGLVDRLFVHTEKMKSELIEEFDVEESHITVIPFGINNAVPNTDLTRSSARRRLGIREGEKVILFFGNITPYKGIQYLVEAFHKIRTNDRHYRLIIAGRPCNCDEYWSAIKQIMKEDLRMGRALVRDEFVPDDETEIYFKAADVLVLPYTHVYQSGVLFLGYSFGLPALAADVGSLKDDIVEGKTGFSFKPEDGDDLAKMIERYFNSDLFAGLDRHREKIRDYALELHSWDTVGQTTVTDYGCLLQPPHEMNPNVRNVPVNVKEPS